MAFTFRYYDVRMPQEPLHIEDVSGPPSGQRMLRLRGPIVLTNFFEFQSMVCGNTSRHLILDLTGVPYIDSAGIGALVGAYVNHQKDGRSLALVGVTKRVRDAMEVTRVAVLPFPRHRGIGARHTREALDRDRHPAPAVRSARFSGCAPRENMPRSAYRIAVLAPGEATLWRTFHEHACSCLDR